MIYSTNKVERKEKNPLLFLKRLLDDAKIYDCKKND